MRIFPGFRCAGKGRRIAMRTAANFVLSMIGWLMFPLASAHAGGTIGIVMLSGPATATVNQTVNLTATYSGGATALGSMRSAPRTQ